MTIPKVRLGEVIEIKGGGTPSKSNPDFWNGDIPWVSPKDMKSWEIKDAADKITQSALKGSATNLIPANSILLVNRSGILKHTLPVGITRRPVAINQDIKALVCGSQAHPEYIAHLVKSAEPIVLTWVRATTADNFPINNLRELEIPLPPLDEQKRIAAILDKADQLRQKRRQAIALLDSLTQSIFLEMFGDPVGNPKSWKQIKLGDSCAICSSKRVFASEFTEGGVPFYRGTEVGKLATGDNVTSELYISSNHYDRLIQETGRPEAGDLLLPSICKDGRIWKVDSTRDFYFKDGRVLWIKKNENEFNSDYLLFQLKNMLISNYESIASGTTFAELKIVNLKNLIVLRPPLDLQVEFSARVSRVQGSQSASRLSEENTADLFSSLQHRAFSGQL